MKPKRKRFNYSKNCMIAQIGVTGRLMCLKSILVTAGDSIQGVMNGIYKLSPLRKSLPFTPKLTICGFYTPHRHYFPEIVDMVNEGYDTTITFDTLTIVATGFVDCTGFGPLRGTVPSFCLVPYIHVYNQYVRDPSDTSAIYDDDYLIDASSEFREFGLECCHLPTFWSVGRVAQVTASDYRFALVDTDKIDLLVQAQTKGRMGRERKIEFDRPTDRYRDTMDDLFGTYINTDADQRPSMVFCTDITMQAYDVDGTSQDNLGDYSSRAGVNKVVGWPMRQFPEHGVLQIFSILRWEPAQPNETHYLVKNTPTYKTLIGDPLVLESEAPVSLRETDFILGSSDTTTLGLIPYGDWLRQEPPSINRRIFNSQGWPFIKSSLISFNTSHYVKKHDYDPVFKSLELLHYQVYGQLNLDVKSFVIPGEASIYAGSK